MLGLPERQRPARAGRILADLMPEEAVVVLLDRLEVLFEPSLQLQPVGVLRALSRNRTVVASWPGVVEAGRLLYAEPGHPEYLNEPADGVRVVEIFEDRQNAALDY